MDSSAIQTQSPVSSRKLQLHPVYAIYGMVFSALSTFIASFTIAIVSKTISSRRFLISDTFRSDPARAIASFGLSLTSAFAFVVFFCRYLLGSGSRRENVAMALAVFACICMLGVHAFTLTYSRLVHNSSAFGLFISGISAATLFASEERKLNDGRLSSGTRMRYFLLSGSVLSLLVMVTGFLWNWAVSSAAEISMALFMFACLASYHHEFRTRRVLLAIHLSP